MLTSSGFARVLDLESLPPGSSREIEFEEREVALFNVDGTVYAVSNACPHRQGPICEGLVKGTTVTCPYHFSRFELRDGALVDGPATEGLESFEVLLEDDAIWLRAR